jgi:hypothetical protein
MTDLKAGSSSLSALDWRYQGNAVIEAIVCDLLADK